MTPGPYPDNCIDELTPLQNLLTETEKPITDRHFTSIVLRGLTEEYRDVNRMTWKDRHCYYNYSVSTTPPLPYRLVTERDG